jgi:hypothetical protein
VGSPAGVGNEAPASMAEGQSFGELKAGTAESRAEMKHGKLLLEEFLADCGCLPGLLHLPLGGTDPAVVW